MRRTPAAGSAASFDAVALRPRVASRRSLVSVGVALGALVALSTSASATANVTARRLAGEDRFATAQTIATTTFAGGSNVAIIASGANFPDALAASYLAGSLRAPVLLTRPDGVPAATASALQSLNVAGVTIVGGPEAVFASVETDLRGRGYVVDRIFGANRYETARRIAETPPATSIGSLPGGPGRTAMVASGRNFPDALAAGPVSADAAYPLLLTTPGALSTEASGALDTLAIKQVVLLGGEEAVSADVANAITAKGIAVRRVAGAAGTGRAETAVALADLAVSALNFSTAHVNLARGDDFPDALSGGPHGAVDRSAILLTGSPTVLGPAAQGWLQKHAATMAAIDVFGGPSAVSDETVQAARRAAGATS